MKRTRIICTVGPNTSNRNVTMKLARNGMNVAHFSFSCGDYNGHQGRSKLLRKMHRGLDIPAAALLGTRGPEVRTGQPKNGRKVTSKEGQVYTLTARELVGNDTVGYINYSGLNEDVTAGSRILIDGRLIELGVYEVKDTGIVYEVISGGELGEKKEVNVLDVEIKLLVLADEDKEDIRFGIRQGFDFTAASFVRTADYIKEIKAMLGEQGSGMKVITKIENAEGIENLDVIIEAAGGIMVARGDMGVKISVEKVPHIQRKIIRKCNETRKIVITAIQILGFIIRNPRPTRAEVADAANAVYDGTDVVMFSDKTAIGKYPVDTLKTMVSIALETGRHLGYAGYRQREVTEQNVKNVPSVVCLTSVSTTHDPDVDVIIAPSTTGFTTQMLSKRRPGARIIGMSPSMATVRQTQLQQGVIPAWSRGAEPMGELIESSVEKLKDRGLVEGGELAVIMAGVVTYVRRHRATTQTNTMRVTNIE